ncbi:MAG: hypothetical protein AAGM22_32955 [Acidobacteriota bacterium]
MTGRSRFRGRPLLTLAVVFFAALALSWAEAAYRGHRAALSQAGPGVQWIWAPEAAKRGEPTAFFAVRDFHIPADSKLWIQLTVDEAHSLWVNGRRVGSGLYVEAAPAELYDVSDFVKAGWNRVMIEASSGRGAGGILASLRLDDPSEVFLGSDDGWRIFEDSERWLIAGFRTMEPGLGRAPVVWQLPPTGRWRLPEEVRPGRRLAEFEPFIYPLRLRHPSAPSTPEIWRQLEPRERLPNLETQAVFEFPGQVLGHLEMGLDADAGPGLLFFDDEDPGSPAGRSADAVLAAVPGLREWHDPQARRFRYVTVVGAAPVDWIRVRPATEVDADPDRTEGVFGMRATSPFRRVEEAVWRRLQE